MRSSPETMELDTLCLREALLSTDLVSLRLQLCLRADSRHMSGASTQIEDYRLSIPGCPGHSRRGLVRSTEMTDSVQTGVLDGRIDNDGDMRKD